MRWASERWRQLCCSIALRRIQLRLDKKDTPSEVSSSEVGIPEVGPDQIGHSQVGPSEVSPNEACTSQVSASEVSAFKFGPNEVGSSVVLLGLHLGSHEFACMQQQGADISSVCCHIQIYENIGAGMRETFDLRERESDLTMEWESWSQNQRFGQIPEQFMEIPHDWKHLEHRLCRLRVSPPVLSAEGNLGDFLPRAETIVNSAASKALLPEAWVDAAAKVRL